MKRPPLIFRDELVRQVQVVDIEGPDDLADAIVKVHTDALYPVLVERLGWNSNRAERMQLEFQDVVMEHPREAWLEELDAVWMRYQRPDVGGVPFTI